MLNIFMQTYQDHRYSFVTQTEERAGAHGIPPQQFSARNASKAFIVEKSAD
jgi:hypothetical protein